MVLVMMMMMLTEVMLFLLLLLITTVLFMILFVLHPFSILCYWPVQLECQTEDGVRVDAVGHLNLSLTAPDGTLFAGSSVYRKPTQNREGVVTYTPQTAKHLEHAGQWSVSCQFTEYREKLKSILLAAKHLTTSDEAFKFTVLPGKAIVGCAIFLRAAVTVFHLISGPAQTLSVKFASENAGLLSASSTADARGRTILPRAGKK